MTLDVHLSFIGSGNMASALVSGLLSSGTTSPQRITASDPRAEALAELQRVHGITVTTDNTQAVLADVLVLSIKPQVFPQLLSELGPRVDAARTLVISIAAGVSLAAIEARLPPGTRVVRAMPNTPALVSAGATALAAGTHASELDLQMAEQIFRSVGIVVRVPEDRMDAVTALSGSGPAYVFLLAEALTEAGVQVGLEPEVAAQLARQTVHGAGKLLAQSSESAEELRGRVTSPGGTTHAGVTKLEELGFGSIVGICVQAARDRGRELGKEAARKLENS